MPYLQRLLNQDSAFNCQPKATCFWVFGFLGFGLGPGLDNSRGNSRETPRGTSRETLIGTPRE